MSENFSYLTRKAGIFYVETAIKKGLNMSILSIVLCSIFQYYRKAEPVLYKKNLRFFARGDISVFCFLITDHKSRFNNIRIFQP